MPRDPAFVIHSAAYFGLLASEGENFNLLSMTIERMALSEIQRGEFRRLDESGEVVEFLRVGRFAIGFLPATSQAPLQILDILEL